MLRNRVRSYFQSGGGHGHSPRIALMVRQVCEIEFIVTDSEAEALALEANLIKNHQPHFNVLLKDDKKYPYLCITWSEPYPRIFITRRRRFRSPLDRFYGPYVDVGLLRRTLGLVKRVFPLRQRPQPLHRDRTCLNYDIGRCPGVCQEKISSDDYHRTLRQVAMVFQGRNEELLQLLQEQMERYAERLDFESAARVRDQLQGIDTLTADQKMSLGDSSVSRDVIALAADGRGGGGAAVPDAGGKLVGRLGFTADAVGTPLAEEGAGGDLPPSPERREALGRILQTVIEEHYSQVEPVEIPPELLLQVPLPQQALIEEWLCERRGGGGEAGGAAAQQKAELIELVERNAGYELQRAQRSSEQQLLATEDLASCWSSPPRRGGSRATTSATSRAAMRWPPGGLPRWPAGQAALPQVPDPQQCRARRPLRRLHEHGGGDPSPLPPLGPGQGRGGRPAGAAPRGRQRAPHRRAERLAGRGDDRWRQGPALGRDGRPCGS